MCIRDRPGSYQVTASKEGLGYTATATIQVAQSQTTRPNLVLAAAATPAAAPPTVEQELQAMKDRIAVLEAELKSRSGGAPAAQPNPPPAAPPAGAQTPAPPQAAASTTPEALQPPPPAPAVDNDTPFAYGDFTWLNGSPRNKDTVLDTKFFTPEVRFDTNFMEDFNQPIDHTICLLYTSRCV